MCPVQIMGEGYVCQSSITGATEKCRHPHQDHHIQPIIGCYRQFNFNTVKLRGGSALSHPGVGERGVVVLRVELQSDESVLCGDPGHHGLHRLVPGDAHILERSRQENHPVCDIEGKVQLQCHHIIKC